MNKQLENLKIQQFIEHHLPDRKQFEFHVYSLHPTVYANYKDKADRVLQLDPDKPGQIWIKPDSKNYIFVIILESNTNLENRIELFYF